MPAADSLCEISNMGRACHVKHCKNSQRNAHVFSINEEKAKHFTEEFGYEFETRGASVDVRKSLRGRFHIEVGMIYIQRYKSKQYR